MVFRFQAQSVFLTYPRCTLSKEDVLVQLRGIRPIKEYCIAEEMHQDGYPHIHAYVQFLSKLNTNNERYFDLARGPIVFHPNIQKPRSIKAVSDYITKDENYIHSPKFKDLGEKLDWSEMGVDVSTTQEFMNKVLANHPKEYWLHYQKLKEAADLHFTPKVNIYDAQIPEQPFLLPQAIDEWVTSEFPKVNHSLLN